MVCPDDTTFAAYLDGALATADATAFERHLDVCPGCREALAALGRLAAPGAAPPPPRPGRPRRRGDACGRYLVLDVLGAGGMGVVYAAYDPELDRKVALKQVRPHAARGAAGLRERLAREARVLARISHPNVVPVYDVGEADGDVFVAMEFVPGPTLARWQAEAPRPWRAVLDMYLQAARGLAHAHAAGVVHRDFKPSNAIVGPDGRVRVVDFGLALADEAARDPDLPADEPSAARTAAGALVGTPAYMAPEQRRGPAVDARSDQYSFCAALWEALTGAPPTAADTTWHTSPVPAARPPGTGPQGHAPSHLPSRTGPSDRAPHDPAPHAHASSVAPHDPASSVAPHAPSSSFAPHAPASSFAPSFAPHAPASSFAPHDPATATLRPRPAVAPRDPRPQPPRWLRAIALRGLAPDPAARFPDMRALIDACERGRARARRLTVGLAALGLAAAAAVLVPAATAAPQACQDDPRLLAGIWDPDAALALRRAFTRGGQPWADTSATSTIAALDAYAARLRAEERAACEATRVFGRRSETDLSRRTACLDDRRAALRARVDLLRRGEPDVVERALAIAHDLPDPERCREPAALAAYADPTDDATRARLRAAIDGADALLRAGRYPAAEAAVADARQAARARGLDPLAAEAHLLFAEARQHQGDAAAAEDALYLSLWSAEAAHDDRLAALAWSRLTRLLGDELARPAEARRAAAHARAASERAGADVRLVAALQVDAAIAERAAGDFPAANAALRAAVAALEARAAPDDPRLFDALRLYGRSFYDLGDLEAAVTTYQRALAVAETTLGAAHPAVADLANNLGTTLIDLRQPDAAEPWLQRALAIHLRAHGRTHLSTGATQTNLANLAQLRGDVVAAERRYREALQAYAAQPIQHPDAAKVAYNLGMLLIVQQRPVEALAQFEFALARLRATLGDDHPDAGAFLTGVGVAQNELARFADAAATLQSAVDVFERRPRDIRYLAAARIELARALWDSGADRSRARAQAEQAAASVRDRPEAAGLLRDAETWLAAHPPS